MIHRMRSEPFRPSPSLDEIGLALAIEDDAAALAEGQATLARYLDAVPDLARRGEALDAALEVALHAETRRAGCTPLEAARAIGRLHPAYADALLACALGLGIAGAAPRELAEGSVVFGRWRIERLLGRGASATAFLAVDEVLSTDSSRVEVVVKRFDDAAGIMAREHALREARALLHAPRAIAPLPVALLANAGEPAYLVVQHEPSRAAESLSDVAEAARSVRRLHRVGLAHGDLKPDHLRVRSDGSVFLVDFGLAGPATQEARSADFMRLATSAGRLAEGRLARSCCRASSFFASRGRDRRALLMLLAASPRHHRRAVRVALPRALIVVAALACGIWSGRMYAEEPPPNPEPLLKMLEKTGRFIGARVDETGRIHGLTFFMPELEPFAAQGGVGARAVRFGRDGSVEFDSIDFPDSVSPSTDP